MLSAAEIIMDASIGYDYMVNPKILLTLLGSISGIVSDSHPTQNSLDRAMGNFDPTQQGFAQQVRLGSIAGRPSL